MKNSFYIILLILSLVSLSEARVSAPECYGLIPSEADGTMTEQTASQLKSRKVCIQFEDKKKLKNGYISGNYNLTFFDQNGEIVKLVNMSFYHNNFSVESCCGPFTMTFASDLKSLREKVTGKRIILKRSMEDTLVHGSEIGNLNLFDNAHFVLTEIVE